MYFINELLSGFKPGQESFVFMWGLALVAFIAVVINVERWLRIKKLTDVNALAFIDEVCHLIDEQKHDQALKICDLGGERALAGIAGAAIRQSLRFPHLVKSAMEEEFLKVIPSMDRRLNLIFVISNLSTMIGLMGTIWGLIIAFSAISNPGVAAVEKSSLLAAGVSTAMNTTLVGLTISIPCLLSFFIFRNWVDRKTVELDRYALHLLRVLSPGVTAVKNYKFSSKRISEDIDHEPNIGPMMSLIVILIPLLLSSAEFVKVGAIELHVPDNKKQEQPKTEEKDEKESIYLGLKLKIGKEGFYLSHYFKDEGAVNEGGDGSEHSLPDIPMADGRYDFKVLQKKLAEIKRLTLLSLAAVEYDVDEDAPLDESYVLFAKVAGSESLKGFLEDRDQVKISAEKDVPYQTIISVMDSAREVQAKSGKIPLFPSISFAGSVTPGQ
ncbi:MAG: MotA/TolQ/ExbB proton channel family protein [Deltaproteobacteria bacterium]|nr:MotA/TolQ/ExbB proton channel family protein [Deltaproteobacteria bacterium]